MINIIRLSIALTIVPLTGPWVVRAEPPAATAVEQARAVIVDRCLSCHSGAKPKGGLDLTRRDRALKGGDSGAGILPGKPDDSLVVEKAAAGEMPPKGPLGPDAVKALRAWVEAGAPYGIEPLVPRRAGRDWWSLGPIQTPEPPRFDGSWVRNPIDAFILQALQKKGLAPSPEADRVALIRRLSFDLIGLPPSPEEVEAFVSDRLPDAYERLVDRLLASPRYGERWARHWLDVVRFGESHGYEMNQPRPNAWPYRDYVIRAFNRDTPLPRFALEQLAADTLPDESLDGLTRAATGFLVGGTHDMVGNATPEGKLQQRADDLDDMIAATGSAFLGLTIQCARCHDHKFDPIAQRDYYGLAAVFAGVTHAERDLPGDDPPARRAEAARAVAELATIDRQLDAASPLAKPDEDRASRPAVSPSRNVERFATTAAIGVRITVLTTSGGLEPCVDELEAWTAGDAPRNVALATAGGVAGASSEYPSSDIHKIVHLNDGRVGNGRSWISRSPGRGRAWVTWSSPAAVDRVVWGRDREGRFRDRTAAEYYVEIQTPGPSGGWVVVASSSDRASAETPESAAVEPGDVKRLRERQAALHANVAELSASRKVYAGTFAAPAPTHVLRRGDPTQPGDVVSPSAPSAVSPALVLPADAPEPARRAALARWLGDPANPLPARVTVNRVWHHHFGRGIVATPGDFGFNGAPPSHPALLDWLASTYSANGFHLKPIHRLIVLSATYRQASRPEPKALALDRDSRWLWRFPPRRLEAEPIRDAVLAVSGALDPSMGGPGYSVWEKNTNYVMVYNPKSTLGPAEFRRMVYQFKPRSRQDPTFGAFDCPDAALPVPKRTVSTTPLQALNLLNGSFLLDQSERLAARLSREAGPDPASQADRGFRLAFSRPPTPSERAGAVALIGRFGLPAFCRAMFNANEFIYVE